MRKFRDIPIREKLMVIIMATAAAALLLAGAGVITLDNFLFRASLKRDLSALSQIVGDNSTAALAFNDSQAASETLSALRARPHLVDACVYRLDGSVLAGYARPGAALECPSAQQEDALKFRADGLYTSHAIFLSGRRVGTLVLLYDLNEIAERLRVYGAMVLGVLVVSTLMAYLLSSRLRAIIATPISQLVRTATSVSATSDYSLRAPKLGGDELGVLVDEFNEMLDGIQSRDRDLRTALQDREIALREAEKARERFRFLAESMPQKIYTATPIGEIDYFNRQWIEFGGLPLEAIKNWGWVQFVHPDDIEANVRAWRDSIRTGEPFHLQHRFRRADGVYRWHLSRAHAMRDADGTISMWIGSSTDIHEQKEKEEDLERANADLQQFAYSASHDLQEPIRNVVVYSEIISKRYHETLDPEGQQFLGFLTEGGRRLATLISDLLAYTRAGSVEDISGELDSGAVLQHAVSSLAEAIRESGATVTYGAMPHILMGEAHLQQVFQNLISNALKYRTQEAPRIHISAIRQGAGWRFSIQDNGIGIDPQFKEKIFGVFKRLHRDQKYPGTGIGLAICQRVVRRYGGRIWVESEPGHGATFYFTVPRFAERTSTAALGSTAG